MVQLSARDVVHNALPQLHVSENHTKSSAWHPIYFVGPLAPWGNFVRDVQNFDASQVWSRVVIDHELVSRDLHREKVWLGDEHGLQGRFQQSVGQIVGAALEAQSINITFGDFKASGVAYDKVPDVALLAKGPTFVLPSSSKRILILSNPCAMAILPYLEYLTSNTSSANCYTQSVDMIACTAARLPLAAADWQFKSGTDLAPPRLNITIPAAKDIETGYLFIAPFPGQWAEPQFHGPRQEAPYIVRDDGELVWSGYTYFSIWASWSRVMPTT